jgi:hypothetical protein
MVLILCSRYFVLLATGRTLSAWTDWATSLRKLNTPGSAKPVASNTSGTKQFKAIPLDWRARRYF